MTILLAISDGIAGTIGASLTLAIAALWARDLKRHKESRDDRAEVIALVKEYAAQRSSEIREQVESNAAIKSALLALRIALGDDDGNGQ